MAPHKGVHRSKSLTKNYCSKICWHADDAVHKVCCSPDKELRQIEERKVKVGGKEKVEASNAGMDFLSEHVSSSAPSPTLGNNFQEIIKKTKKSKATVVKRKETQIDEVD